MKYYIQGKYASEFSQTLEVAVVKCTNESNPERPCANESQIQAYFQQQQSFFFTIYFINPLINPTSDEYLTHYLEDNNYIIFTKNLGAEGIILMEQYTITTDQSILPYPTPRQQSGGFVSQFALKNPYEVQTNVYCSFAFFKSGTTRNYQRNFQRLDDILSYIGGLFGTIVILLFLVKLYNEFSFEIAFGAELLHSKNEKDQETLKQYNFFRFLFHGFYKFLQIFGCSPGWEIYQQFDDCQEEMVRQLDVVYLIKRIMLLQKAILTLLGEHQLKGLLLQQKLTLEQMKKKRKNFKIKRNLIQLGEQVKEKSKKSPKNRIEQNIQFFNSKVFNPSGLQSFNQMINPKETMRDESTLRHQRENIFAADFYDSELSSSSSESDMENKQEIVQQLHQLKLEAINGDQVSEKIWQNCNKKMKNKIQYLISAEPNKIVSLNHLGTETGLNSNSPQSSSSLKHVRQRNGVNSNKKLTRRLIKKKVGKSPQKTDSSVEGQKRKQQTIENLSDPVINQQNIIRIRSFHDFST